MKSLQVLLSKIPKEGVPVSIVVLGPALLRDPKINEFS